MSPVVYLIYRWVLALFFVIAFLIERDSFKRWYTGYFTGWGMATICIYLSLYVILCSYQYYKSRKQPKVSMTTMNDDKEFEIQPIEFKQELHPGMVWGYKIVWMLFNVAAVNALIVTIGYWGAIHSRMGAKSLVGKLGYHNITAHLVNSIVMLIEGVVTPFPVRLLHVVYSNLYGLLYVTASIIFWLASGQIFYSFLDYSKQPGLAAIVIVIGFCIFQPLMQLLYYGIYRFREWLLTRGTRDQTDQSHVIAEC